MKQVINAIWDGKVFRPLEPVKLPSHSKVTITVQTRSERRNGKPYSLLRRVAAMNLEGPTDWSEHFEDYLNGTRKLT